MPLSGLLSVSTGGWPSIFYVFGAVGTVWSLAFIFLVFEDPEIHPRINQEERKYIINALWGTAGVSVSKRQKLLFIDNNLYNKPSLLFHNISSLQSSHQLALIYFHTFLSFRTYPYLKPILINATVLYIIFTT